MLNNPLFIDLFVIDIPSITSSTLMQWHSSDFPILILTSVIPTSQLYHNHLHLPWLITRLLIGYTAVYTQQFCCVMTCSEEQEATQHSVKSGVLVSWMFLNLGDQWGESGIRLAWNENLSGGSVHDKQLHWQNPKPPPSFRAEINTPN